MKGAPAEKNKKHAEYVRRLLVENNEAGDNFVTFAMNHTRELNTHWEDWETQNNLQEWSSRFTN